MGDRSSLRPFVVEGAVDDPDDAAGAVALELDDVDSRNRIEEPVVVCLDFGLASAVVPVKLPLLPEEPERAFRKLVSPFAPLRRLRVNPDCTRVLRSVEIAAP